MRLPHSACSALGILFDPAFSEVRLLSIGVTSPTTVEATWQLGGFLNRKFFPWNPKVPFLAFSLGCLDASVSHLKHGCCVGTQVDIFQGTATWTVGEDGLIVEQRETWSISPLKALTQTFTPYFGEPFNPFNTA